MNNAFAFLANVSPVDFETCKRGEKREEGGMEGGGGEREGEGKLLVSSLDPTLSRGETVW